METLFIISAFAMPLVMLALVWLITGHFAWSALSAVVFFVVIKLLQKKLGYGKTVLFEILVVIAVFAGDQVRVEFLNDSRKKEGVRQEEETAGDDLAETGAKRLDEEALRQKKRELVKDFALKESPSAWKVFVSLERKCDIAGTRDGDFIAAKSNLSEMKATRDALWKSLERAYIQYIKFKASIDDAALAELSGSATAAVIKEAEAVKERCRAMMQEK